jgi:hypothetical protein
MPTTLHPVTETDRVRRFTSPEMLQQIEDQIERNIASYASQTDEVISERIEALKREWSLNRYLQANVAAVGLIGALLGLKINKNWALLTVGAFGIFLIHGLRGWDPRIRVLRRMGVRTRSEIDREIYALKVLRGDFRDVPADQTSKIMLPVREIMRAVNA